MYVAQGCHIVLAVLAVSCACVVLQFVLVPMLMAYFVTFLLGPVMDAMEHRPYQLGSSFYCKENFLHPARKRYAKTARGECLDMTLLVKLPHMLAVVVCLILCGIAGSSLVGVGPCPNRPALFGCLCLTNLAPWCRPCLAPSASSPRRRPRRSRRAASR